MNRRKFTQSLGMLFTLPALPAKAFTAAPVAATTIPNAARFWAIYMSQMHGTVSAATLANMTGISASAAQTHLTSMIADGVIKPQNLIKQALQVKTPTQVKPQTKHTKLDLREKLRKFADPDRAMDDTDIAVEDTASTPKDTTTNIPKAAS